MSVYIIGAFGTLMLVGGVFLIVRRVRDAMEEKNIIAVSDIAELNELKSVYNKDSDEESSLPLSSHIVKENLKRSEKEISQKDDQVDNKLQKVSAPVASIDQEVDQLREEINILVDENEHLKDALKRESHRIGDVTVVSEEDIKQFKEQEAKNREVDGFIDRLQVENNRLREQISDQEEMFSMLEDRINRMITNMEQAKGKEHSALKILEEHVNAIKAESQQQENVQNELEKAMQEVDSLKSTRNEQIDKMKGIEEELSQAIQKSTEESEQVNRQIEAFEKEKKVIMLSA